MVTTVYVCARELLLEASGPKRKLWLQVSIRIHVLNLLLSCVKTENEA